MVQKGRVAVFTGAGVSAESGLKTFRGEDGLWEGHPVEKVATPAGWKANPELVLEFYNQRRESVRKAQPNRAHLRIAELDQHSEVWVITQNIDDLHERAGSTKVVHLHGEVLKARSSSDESLVYELGEKDIHIGDMCEHGSQLRPHVVWFGERLAEFDRAYDIVCESDALLVIGTSLQVYPAALLALQAPECCSIFVLDPNAAELRGRDNWNIIQKTATEGIDEAIEKIMQTLEITN